MQRKLVPVLAVVTYRKIVMRGCVKMTVDAAIEVDCIVWEGSTLREIGETIRGNIAYAVAETLCPLVDLWADGSARFANREAAKSVRRVDIFHAGRFFGSLGVESRN